MLPRTVHYRGLQFSKLDGIQNQIERYLQNNNFLPFAYAFKICKKYIYDHNKLLPKIFVTRYIKNAEFRADPKFFERGPKRCSEKVGSKKRMK
jgi:hypothetical protein